VLAIREYEALAAEQDSGVSEIREACETEALARESLEIGFSCGVQCGNKVDTIDNSS